MLAFASSGEDAARLESATYRVFVSFTSLDHPPSCARRIFSIADALCRAVGDKAWIHPGGDGLMVCRWIMRMRGLLLALEARFLAGTLRVVLAEPGMVALLGPCPQGVRAVAPLCRMLGIIREDFVPRADQAVTAVAALAAAALVPARPVPAVEPINAGTLAALPMARFGWVQFISG